MMNIETLLAKHALRGGDSGRCRNHFGAPFLYPARQAAVNLQTPAAHHSTTPSLPHSAFVDTLHAFSYPPPVNTERVYPEFTSGLFFAGPPGGKALKLSNHFEIHSGRGAQGGDEGKGKIIDVLTEQADVVVRTQGGNNAGHTVHIKGQKYVLHLVPSGILRPKKTCVIGNGVVVDPVSLVEEIEGLRKLGVKVAGNLFLSETAHLVFPYHRELDAQREILKGKNKIGTTKRGIGPAYGDKAARTGLRVIDLVNPERFRRQLESKIKENNEILKAFGAEPLSFEQIHQQYRTAGDYLRRSEEHTSELQSRFGI